jgi:hypothetical protein
MTFSGYLFTDWFSDQSTCDVSMDLFPDFSTEFVSVNIVARFVYLCSFHQDCSLIGLRVSYSLDLFLDLTTWAVSINTLPCIVYLRCIHQQCSLICLPL